MKQKKFFYLLQDRKRHVFQYFLKLQPTTSSTSKIVTLCLYSMTTNCYQWIVPFSKRNFLMEVKHMNGQSFSGERYLRDPSFSFVLITKKTLRKILENHLYANSWWFRQSDIQFYCFYSSPNCHTDKNSFTEKWIAS